MSVSRIATRYAKSLLDLATEQGQLEAVHADMVAFAAALGSRDLVLMLQSPMINADKKEKVFEALFGSRFSALTLAFFRICVRKGREGYLPDMAHAFAAQYRARKNILAIRVTSATPLPDGALERIASQVKAAGVSKGEIEWDLRVDPALIGGFVLELDDRRYDASIAHKLDQLRKEFRQNASI